MNFLGGLIAGLLKALVVPILAIRHGMVRERLDAAEESLESHEEANKVERDIGRLSPVERRRKLREWKRE